MPSHTELLLNLFAAATTSSAPDSGAPVEETPLHPYLTKLTMAQLLKNTEKGRYIMREIKSGECIHRQALLDLSNYLREPIMKFCEKRNFPTRNEQRAFLNLIFAPYPNLDVETFVSNKKQQSGLLENSIRNARRRASGKRRTKNPPAEEDELDEAGQTDSDGAELGLEAGEPREQKPELADSEGSERDEDDYDEAKGHSGVSLAPVLLQFDLEEMLGLAAGGADMLGKLRARQELQRADYLFMSNIIRDPIMRFCEKPNYPSRYEQRAFLDHLFTAHPQVDMLTFVGNKKQSLGCLENSIRNGRRSRRSTRENAEKEENTVEKSIMPFIIDAVRNEVVEGGETVQEKVDLKRANRRSEGDESSDVEKVGVKPRPSKRPRSPTPMNVNAILKSEILQLSKESVLQESKKGVELLPIITENREVDRSFCLDLANLIRGPIMRHCQVPDRPTRQELRAYFLHLFPDHPKLHLLDFVSNKKRVVGFLENSIRSARRQTRRSRTPERQAEQKANVDRVEAPCIDHDKIIVLSREAEVAPPKAAPPEPAAQLHPDLKPFSLADLLCTTIQGRMLHQKIQLGEPLERFEYMELCKAIRGPIMQYCEREWYPRRMELRTYLQHIFKGLPHMEEKIVLFVCNKKQHLGYLEDSIHNFRRKLRTKLQNTAKAEEGSADASPQPDLTLDFADFTVELPEQQSGEDGRADNSITSQLLQSAINYIRMQREEQRD